MMVNDPELRSSCERAVVGTKEWIFINFLILVCANSLLEERACIISDAEADDEQNVLTGQRM